MRVNLTRLSALLMVFAAPCSLPAQSSRPYTAEFKVTSVQTLANGGTISRETTEEQVRDAQGRTLISNQRLASDVQNAVTTVRVHDPVAGTDTTWDSLRKRATVMTEPPRDQRHGCWESDTGHLRWIYHPAARADAAAASSPASASLPSPPKPVREDLGTTTIQGIEAHGIRRTWTTPAGEIGNDVPLVRTSEVWSSKVFPLVLREVSDDPRSGKHTRELVRLDLGEPDVSLFAPPEDYEIVTVGVHQVACDQWR